MKILISNILILTSFLFSQFSDYTETVHFNISTDRVDYRAGESIKILFDFDTLSTKLTSQLNNVKWKHKKICNKT